MLPCKPASYLIIRMLTVNGVLLPVWNWAIFSVVTTTGGIVDNRQQNQWHELYRKFFTRYERSGLSASEFCRKERISTNTFYYRRKKLRELSGTCQTERTFPVTAEMELLPVIIKGDTPDLSLPYHVRFPNELQLSIPARFNSMATAELIRLCRECR